LDQISGLSSVKQRELVRYMWCELYHDPDLNGSYEPGWIYMKYAKPLADKIKQIVMLSYGSCARRERAAFIWHKYQEHRYGTYVWFTIGKMTSASRTFL
ncbi:MAG: hypothetical protein AAFR27_14325, partial [Pseudomonadota bacterium]